MILGSYHDEKRRAERPPPVSRKGYLAQRDDAQGRGDRAGVKAGLKGANDRNMEILVPGSDDSRGF